MIVSTVPIAIQPNSASTTGAAKRNIRAMSFKAQRARMRATKLSSSSPFVRAARYLQC
jgi:hypothetical protein